MNMKRLVASLIMIVTLVVIGPVANALTLSDIQLLVNLGLISGEQAEIAEQAIGAGDTSSGTGAAISQNEFSEYQCLILNQNLVLGMSGTAISAVQRFLIQQGHLTEEATGYYGLLTQQAVADFQIAQGLITTRDAEGAGNVGPLTRSKIQEISCAAAAPQEEEAEPEIDPTQFERRERPAVVAEPEESFDGVHRITLDAELLETDEYEGTAEYRYHMTTTPNDYVDQWFITLTCDDATRITTDRRDLMCGDTIRLRATTKGDKTFKIEYKNTSQIVQAVVVTTVARDVENDEILGRASYEVEIEPINERAVQQRTRQQLGTSQPIVIGDVQIPENRLCDYDEQLDYLRYVMTRTVHPGDQALVPPPCWPGEVYCTYDTPPSFCRILNTEVSSNDLCPQGELFYDGRCYEQAQNRTETIQE